MHTWPNGLDLSVDLRREMAANIKARRQLSELYRQGEEIRFSKGPNGKPEGKIGPFVDDRGNRIKPAEGVVAMFIRPPDPVQRDMAMRAAQGKRAAALVKAKRDENSEEYLTIMAFLADMSDETLIDYVIMSDTGLRRNEAEREVLGLDEWKDMTAYQDAMAGFEGMPEEDLEENEEYRALMELDDKYVTQIKERELQLMDAQREALRFLDRSNVERKALEKRSEMIGSQAFIEEYERQSIFFSVRDAENIDNLFFESVHEMAAQPDEVRDVINEALPPFISEEGEAKNSPGVASGSDSSELPVKPETSDPSTPEELSA